MKTNELTQKIEMLMADELGVFSRLIEHLKKEHEAIVGFDIKGLTQTYKNKYQCLQELDQLETERHSTLVELGAFLGWTEKDGALSLEKVIHHLTSKDRSMEEKGEKLLHQLSCLRSMVQAARELNQHQQKYLVHSLADVEASLRLIETLQGSRIPCYDRSGCMTESPVSQANTTLFRSV